MRVRKVLLCLFHWKPRPSRVIVKSPGLENIPQVPGNPPDVCQNHDARKADRDFGPLLLDFPEVGESFKVPGR